VEFSQVITEFLDNKLKNDLSKREFAENRIKQLFTRGLTDENLIISLVEKEIKANFVVPKKLKAEMYDKVNYMCRRYMDRIARFELDYNFIPDIDALKYALICIFESAPVFHSQFIDNHIVPYWRVCDYNIDEVLTVIYTDNFLKSADEFLLKDIPVTSNVQFTVALLIKGKESKLCFAWNHMLVDGGDYKHFVNDLFRNYNAYVESKTMPLDFRTATRSYKSVYDDFNKDDKKKAKTQFAGVSPHDKHILPFTEKSEDDKKYIARKRIPSSVFNKAKDVVKKYDGTVNDLIATAYISAVYEMCNLPENERIGISCAVDLRRYIKNINRTGYTNHTTFMPCIVNSKGESVFDILKQVVECNTRNKEDKFMGLHGLPLLNIGYSTMVYAQAEIVVGLFYNNANLAISNVGKMDLDALSLSGNKPIGAAVAGAAKKKPCAMMTALTINGNLQLSICSVGSEDDKIMLEKFFDLIEKNIKEIAGV